MNKIRFLIPLFLALSVLLGTAPAQGQKILLADKYERATVADAEGLLQWAPWKGDKCPNCEGAKTTKCIHCERLEDKEYKKCIECGKKKIAPCRTCAGAGTLFDPLEKALCPACMGAGFNNCFICGGRGTQKVVGSGDRIFPCVGCKEEGGYKCEVCNGTRLVEPPAVKPGIKDAPAAALVKAREAVDAALKAIAAFEPGKNSRKDMKEFEKVLTPAVQAVLPPLKRSGKALDDYMKNLWAGSQYEGHEDREAEALRQWKSNHEYYLKFEKRLLDLCIARAEANEKVLPDKKGKE
jgi:hypothetical protein